MSDFDTYLRINATSLAKSNARKRSFDSDREVIRKIRSELGKRIKAHLQEVANRAAESGSSLFRQQSAMADESSRIDEIIVEILRSVRLPGEATAQQPKIDPAKFDLNFLERAEKHARELTFELCSEDPEQDPNALAETIKEVLNDTRLAKWLVEREEFLHDRARHSPAFEARRIEDSIPRLLDRMESAYWRNVEVGIKAALGDCLSQESLRQERGGAPIKIKVLDPG